MAQPNDDDFNINLDDVESYLRDERAEALIHPAAQAFIYHVIQTMQLQNLPFHVGKFSGCVTETILELHYNREIPDWVDSQVVGLMMAAWKMGYLAGQAAEKGELQIPEVAAP
jgi:hypothetical protein